MIEFSVNTDINNQPIKFETKELFARLGNIMLAWIRLNTPAGRDYEGKAFAPYSKAYAREKKSSVVNLYSRKPDIEHMWKTLRVQSETDDSIEVGVDPDQQGKVVANENLKNRIFLAIGERLEKKLDDTVDKWFDKQIEKL